MNTYIITWTATIEAEDMETAMEHANMAMVEGSISPDIEQVED